MDNTLFWTKHFSPATADVASRFLNLNSESCIEALKEVGIDCQVVTVLESAENRIFGIDNIVVKFYHPGRWSLEAIKQEALFLKDLEEAKVSTVRTIGEVRTWRGIHYLLYKMIEQPFSESPDILDENSVRKVCHLMAQIHQVGAKRAAPDRAQFDPFAMTTGCFEVIKKAGFLPKELYRNYEVLLNEIVSKLGEFKDIPIQRIHGDSYSRNIVWREGNPIFLDFDDFQMGPIAIDLKLLSFPWRLESLSESMDRKERRKIQQELVLSYYREVANFPKEWEKLFPLVSAYRDIQFDAWFSSRWSEPGFAQNYEDDDITEYNWWTENIEGLENLLNKL